MDAYCTEVCKLKGHFEGLEIHHVPREQNVATDVLSMLGSKCALVPAGVFVQDLCKPSIKILDTEEGPPDQFSDATHDVMMAEAEDDWELLS